MSVRTPPSDHGHAGFATAGTAPIGGAAIVSRRKELEMSIPKYVSSFAAGFAVGAGLTLIYAPMTGKKMQRKIRDVSERMCDKVEDVKAAVVRVAS